MDKFRCNAEAALNQSRKEPAKDYNFLLLTIFRLNHPVKQYVLNLYTWQDLRPHKNRHFFVYVYSVYNLLMERYNYNKLSFFVIMGNQSELLRHLAGVRIVPGQVWL